MTGNVRLALQEERNGLPLPNHAAGAPCEPGTQYRNSHVCRSEAEPVEMVWRSSCVRRSRDRNRDCSTACSERLSS